MKLNSRTKAKYTKNVGARRSPAPMRSRNFAIRLVPELSFSFGLLAMVVIEKALQQSIVKNDFPWTLKALASCVREGFDEVEKLFYKRNNQLRTRVETHLKYAKTQK